MNSDSNKKNSNDANTKPEDKLPEEPAILEEKKVEPGFYVKEGRSITSKGIMYDSGKKINPEKFNGGIENIKALIKKGYIVEVK